MTNDPFRAARPIADMWFDLRHGVRLLTRSPGFTAVAAITLALGVGACSAVFSLINGVILHPFPYEDADRLMLVSASAPGQDLVPLSLPDYLDLRDRNRSFAALGAVYRWNPILAGTGEPERLSAARVSAEMFTALGMPPALGRVFGPDEDRPVAEPVVVLSHAFWMRRFGASPGAIGGTLRLDGTIHTIIGVMPPRFELWTADLWAPIGGDPDRDRLMSRGLRAGIYAIGRPRAGVGIAQTRSDVESIVASLSAEHPETNGGLRGAAVLWRDQTSSDLKPALLMLFGAVGLVLAVAGANLTSLLLARFVTRGQEIGLRMALGAGRGRVVRQILAENLLLALLGAGGGLLLSGAALAATATIFPFESTTAEVRLSLDYRVAGFTVAIAIAAGLLAGLVTGVKSTGPRGPAWYREGSGRLTPGPGSQRMSRLLVAGEVALSLALLVGASLLVQSFVRLRGARPGFDPRGLHSVSVQIPPSRYPERHQRAAFFERLLDEARARPGVVDAALTTDVPFGRLWRRTDMTLLDRPEPTRAEDVAKFSFAMVSDGFFETMRIPLLRGRAFQPADASSAELVAVVNDAARRHYWPDGDPIGTLLLMGPPQALAAGRSPGLEPPAFRVIGVAGDIKTSRLDSNDEPQLYVAFSQARSLPPYALLGTIHLVVRSDAPSSVTIPDIRRAVWSIDPEQPVSAGGALADLIVKSQAQRVMNTSTLIVFAGLAILLAAVGLYGLAANSVAHRTREMGIRIALGARAIDVVRLVIGQGLRVAAAGVAAGVVLTLVLVRAISGLLYQVAPADPLTFAGASACLVAVTMLACYLPARRAARVDPAETLRRS